jgi:hypothetical protein
LLDASLSSLRLLAVGALPGSVEGPGEVHGGEEFDLWARREAPPDGGVQHEVFSSATAHTQPPLDVSTTVFLFFSTAEASVELLRSRVRGYFTVVIRQKIAKKIKMCYKQT